MLHLAAHIEVRVTCPYLRVVSGSKLLIISMIIKLTTAVLESVQIHSVPAGRICTQTTNKKRLNGQESLRITASG